VDVRTYYLDDHDQMAPTKKGVAIHSFRAPGTRWLR